MFDLEHIVFLVIEVVIFIFPWLLVILCKWPFSSFKFLNYNVSIDLSTSCDRFGDQRWKSFSFRIKVSFLTSEDFDYFTKLKIFGDYAIPESVSIILFDILIFSEAKWCPLKTMSDVPCFFQLLKTKKIFRRTLAVQKISESIQTNIFDEAFSFSLWFWESLSNKDY